MKNKTILIVDDDEISLFIIKKIFTADMNVKIATSAKKAIDILNKEIIDCILMDIQMPEMDGFEAAKKIKENKNLKNIPIIFLTSETNKEIMLKCLKIGAKDYILKIPHIEKEELRFKVQNHIESYFLQKELKKQKDLIYEVLNLQDNMVALVNETGTFFMNNSMLGFLGFKNVKEFNLKHKKIQELYEEGKGFFTKKNCLGDKPCGTSLYEIEEEKRIVKIKDKIFKVNIKDYLGKGFMLNFNDITSDFKKTKELEKKVNIDILTKAYTRQYLENNIKKIKNANDLLGYDTIITMLDIDYFKKVNDNYGHNIGDKVLRLFCKTIMDNIRENDILIRWGGEEFILLFSIRKKQNIYLVMEHLRIIIEETDFKLNQKITCSIGGTHYDNNKTLNENIKEIDKLLYKSKNEGRNKVSIK